MAHTYLVAAFDRSNEAEQVKRELMKKGVSQTNIKLTASNDDNISDFFRSIFTDANSQSNAEVYSEAVRHGATVVTVFAEDKEASMVEKIMESNGAIDINERSASWSRESTGKAGERTAIPVMEEELRVGKRENTLGSVRVTSHISERPVEETVRLTEQHAVIERHPVDRPASAEDLEAFKEGSVEVRETAEEAVVSKSARVVEEVVLGKETTQHEETVRDTVRRTDVDIEKKKR